MGIVLFRSRGSVPWYLTGGVPSANCVRAYKPKGAANLAASYVDATGNYNAAPGTAPTHDVTNGWMFDATASQYLKTDWVPTATTSILIRFSNFSTGAFTTLFGATTSATQRFLLYPNHSGGNHSLRWGNYSTAVAPNFTSGVVIVTPAALWLNGVSKDNISAATWGNLSHRWFVGADDNGGGPTQYGTFYLQAMSVYNIDITAYVAVLTAAAQAL